MKTLLSHFLRRALLVCMAASLFGPLAAQQNQMQQRSNTIFAYPKFQKAKILQPFGRYVTADANILLKNASLCYMEGDTVMQANVANILGVEFNDSVRYRKVEGVAMGRVIAEKNWRTLVVVTTIDMEKYREETVGGDNLPFFEMSDLNVFLEIDGDSREEAKGYPLEERYYFLIDGVAVRATEKNIKKYVKPEMKAAFKNLMHDKFWSWNDAKSLAVLLAYI